MTTASACCRPSGTPICGLTSLEGEVTVHQFVELVERMIEQRRQLTARLTPGQLTELHQQRQQLLPADFAEPGAS
jgi:hypothetical protein